MSKKEDLETREYAALILREIEKGEQHSHVLIKGVLDKNDDWESARKAFLKKLVMGVLERKIEMDYIISLYSNTPVKKIKPMVRIILESGIYQILYMYNVFDTKACNLSVELAKKKGLSNLSGFLNGVLRSVVREKESIAYPAKEDNPALYFSVRYSMPEWMVKLFVSQYGEERTERMLAFFLEESGLKIHLKSSLPREEKKKLIGEIEKTISVSKCSYLPDAYSLSHTKEVTNLPGFEEGMFTVQDYASQLVGHLTPLKEGDVVFDVCAAPGGKSMYIADRLKDTGVERAFDVSAAKISRITENANRMGLSNILCEIHDATQENKAFFEKADVVLADVPCSGLGVIGRKPDMKHRLKEEDIESILSLQKQIVKAAVKDLKSGGILVYSTCTVNKAENEETAKWILKNLPLCELPFENLSDELRDSLVSDGSIQLLPGEHDSDGFYIALFKKN